MQPLSSSHSMTTASGLPSLAMNRGGIVTRVLMMLPRLSRLYSTTLLALLLFIALLPREGE